MHFINLMQAKSRGFTILEVLLVLSVVGIIAVAFMPSISSLVSEPETARRLEAAAIAQQQCAERILAARDSIGFEQITLSTTLLQSYCSSLPKVDDVSATVSISNYTSGPCATNQTPMIQCKKLTIGAKDAANKPIKVNDLTLLIAG